MDVSEEYQFIEANKSEMELLSELAHEIWPITFADILSPKQIDYMLNWMYNPDSLRQQIDKGHLFYFLKLDDTIIGFVGVEGNYPEHGLFRIHKIYLKPEFHRKGLGRLMLKKIEQYALSNGYLGLHLNVNRYNRALNFYKKAGFEIIKEEDIEIGDGFLMEDFVMLKKF